MTDDDTQGGWTEARVVAVIRSLAAEDELPAHLQTAEIGAQDTAETLGLDSIGALCLVDRLEEEAGTPLPDDFLSLKDSVGSIAARLRGMAGA
jgi:acyl carrier protein